MAEDNPNGNQIADTSVTDPWAGIAPEVRTHAAIKDFKTPADAVNAYISVQPLIGAEKLPIPGEKATDEDWGKVYDRLGRPKTPADYKFSDIPEALKGLPGTEKMSAGFRDMAHKVGLSAKNAAMLWDWYNQEQVGLVGEYKGLLDTQAEETAKAITAKWGDKAPANLELAQNLMRKFGGEDAVNILTTRAPVVLGDSLPILEMMVAVAGVLGEDALRLPEDQKLGGAEGIQAAQRAIEAILNDSKHLYWDPNPMNKAAHDAAVAEVARLEAIVHPNVKKTE